MLRVTSIIYRTIGVLPINYIKTSRCFAARPLNFLYFHQHDNILRLLLLYAHVTNPHGSYVAPNFHGNRDIALVFYNIFVLTVPGEFFAGGFFVGTFFVGIFFAGEFFA
jgi:hypothetical protein